MHLLFRICVKGATVMLDIFQSSLSGSLTLLDSYPLEKGLGSSSSLEMLLESSGKGVSVGVEEDCLDAAIGAAVGACVTCTGSAAGDGAFYGAAFCNIFARWTLF